MKTYIFEVTNNVEHGPNWGKFLVGIPTGEWLRRSVLSPLRSPLLAQRGWTRSHIMVFDLETGEGAMFPHRGRAGADLNKHRIAVCVLFQDFLAWLNDQDLTDLGKLSKTVIELPVTGRPAGRHPGCPSGLENCSAELAAAWRVVRWLLSTRASPQGPAFQSGLPATAQADPGSPAEDSGPAASVAEPADEEYRPGRSTEAVGSTAR